AGVEPADELLRDRRSALDRLAGGDVRPRGARDADVVDAAVLPEATVLDCHRRARHPDGDVPESDRLTVALCGDRPEQRAVARVDERVLADLDRAQRIQVAARRERRAGAQPDRRDEHGDRSGDGRRDQPCTPAALDPLRALPLAAALREDEVEVVVTALHADSTPVSRRRSAISTRRSDDASSAFRTRVSRLRTETIASFEPSSVTYAVAPSTDRDCSTSRRSAVRGTRTVAAA